MYQTETQASTEIIALDKRLELDASGELRDRLTDELQIAADEVEAALGGEPAAADVRILKSLLEAIKLSAGVVMEVWTAFHDTRDGVF